MKVSKNEFINRSNIIHRRKYTYDDVVFVNSRTKVYITCIIHGNFSQMPHSHLRNSGCPKCAIVGHGNRYRKTTEQFITESELVHIGKYNYDKVEYLGAAIKVTISCPMHGDFLQTPSKHLSGSGCDCCSIERTKDKLRKSPEVFISESNLMHNNFYTYDKVIYLKNSIKVVITCPLHGDFNQAPTSHLGGGGCPKCAPMKFKISKTKSTELFIEQSLMKHDGFYSYNKVVYVSSKVPVIITCPIHGDFNQNPNNHLSGKGCMKCGFEKLKMVNLKTPEQFINEANEVHDRLYTYDSTKYVNNRKKIIITCITHGDFEQVPNSHLAGHGCPKCAIDISTNARRKPLTQFIEEANAVHNNTFNYDKVDYVRHTSKITIVCLTHGDFGQTPGKHLSGRGCPICSASIGERQIMHYLDRNSIRYKFQKSFDGCVYMNKLNFDFYLLDMDICIEFDGEQHFRPIEYFGGIKSFEAQIEKDTIKNNYCIDNHIKLIRIPYTSLNMIVDILDQELVKKSE